MEIKKILLAASFKYIFTFIITLITLGLIIRNNIFYILLIALVATVINFIVGSLIVFRNFEFYISAIIVAILNAIIALIAIKILTDFSLSTIAIIGFALASAIFEYNYNKYILTNLA